VSHRLSFHREGRLPALRRRTCPRHVRVACRFSLKWWRLPQCHNAGSTSLWLSAFQSSLLSIQSLADRYLSFI
jgi:hypothetical protein